MTRAQHQAPDDIVVIGAGPAGLAVSACLRERGLAHAVLERAEAVAPAWRRHYDRLHLHTAKQYSALPHAPWPREVPRYPSRAQVVEYLTRYAEQQAQAPRLGVDVRRVRRHAAAFAVDTRHGTLTPRHVVVATGANAVPWRPALPGLEQFTGSVVHARDYRNPAPYAGLRTLVVGCGNSGAEIALDLAQHQVPVTMVVRAPVHVVPRDLFGRPSQESAVLLRGLPARLRDALVAPVLRGAVGDLRPWGIVRPRVGPYTMIEQTGRVPILDIGAVALIRAGAIVVRPAVQHVSARQVGFADGSTHPFEAIVLATGYTPGLGGLIEGFDAIADARGRPDRFGQESAVPGLYFVGFKNPPTGALREIAIEARRVARAIARHARV